jgi:hypothetical protein
MAGLEPMTFDRLDDGLDSLAGGLSVGAGGLEIGCQRLGEAAGESLVARTHKYLWHGAIVKAFPAAGANSESIF